MKSFLILSFLLSTTALAGITAEFQPNPVQQGNGVEFILSSDQPFKALPNLAVLQKDFLIGGQQQRQSSEFINGKGSTSYELSFTLFPNKAGDIKVEGLTIGNEAVPPVTLSVQKNAAAPDMGTLDMLVECPTQTIYPAQKMLCAVTLEDTMGLMDGTITPPQTSAGTWEQVSAITPINGTQKIKRYQSLFLFTPKESGVIQMPPFSFQGEAKMNTTSPLRARSVIDLTLVAFRSTATRPVAVRSAPFKITVKEKPADYKGWWLPSPKVTISERYEIPEKVAVGEPIARTITLTAANMLANDMPIPQVEKTDGFRAFENPAKREDTPQGGVVSVEWTLVPTKAGENTLPQVSVPWFNVSNEKIEKATLPAKTIFVEAESENPPLPISGARMMNPPTAPQPTQPQAPRPAIRTENPVSADVNAPNAPALAQETKPAALSLGAVLGLVGGAFALGLAVAFLVLRRSKKQAESRKKKKPLPDLYPF